MTEAFVLGGSIAGLLAAAALSPAVDEVVLVERGDLTAGAGRRGVPQGTQVHALLAAGQRAVEALLPGIVEEFDATGRNSKAVDWLGAAGYAPPATKELRSWVSYATATVELPSDVLPPGVAGVISHPHAGALRGAAVVPCDNGLFQISALGKMRADPAKDLDGLLAHLDAAPSPLVAEIARKASVVEPPVRYKVRGSLRRMWEDLPRHPEGLLMLGDSVMSFNPLYGQGMSVAACEAIRLRDILTEHGAEDPGVAGHAQRRFTEVVDTVFGIVVSLDSHYPGAEFEGVAPPSAESAAFGRALSQLATEDAEVAPALKYAGHFFDTSALRSPGIAVKVQAWIAAGRSPAPQDPSSVPPPLAVPQAGEAR